MTSAVCNVAPLPAAHTAGREHLAERLREKAAVRLCCVAGGLVATGLGSDAGIVDLASTINRARQLEASR